MTGVKVVMASAGVVKLQFNATTDVRNMRRQAKGPTGRGASNLLT